MDKTGKKKGKKNTKKTAGPKFDIDVDLDNEEPDIPVAAQKEEIDELKPTKIQHVKVQRIEPQQQIKTQSIHPTSLVKKENQFIVKQQQDELDNQPQIKREAVEIEKSTQVINEKEEAVQRNSLQIVQLINDQPPINQLNEQDLLDLSDPILTKITTKPKAKKQGVKAKPKKKIEVKPTTDIKFNIDDALEEDIATKSQPITMEQLVQKVQEKSQHTYVPQEKTEVYSHQNDQANLPNKVNEDFSEVPIIQQSPIPQRQELNTQQSKQADYPSVVYEAIPPVHQQQAHKMQIKPVHILPPLPNVAIQQDEPINQLQQMIAAPKKVPKPTKKKKTGKTKENPSSNIFSNDFEQEFMKVEEEIQRQTYKQQKREQILHSQQVSKHENGISKVQLSQQQSSTIIQEKKQIIKQSIAQYDHYISQSESKHPYEKHSQNQYIPPPNQQVVEQIKKQQIKQKQKIKKQQKQPLSISENYAQDQINTISILKSELKKVKKTTKGTKKVLKATNVQNQFAFTLDQAIDEVIHRKNQIPQPIIQQKIEQTTKMQKKLQFEKQAEKQQIQNVFSLQLQAISPAAVINVNEETMIEKDNLQIEGADQVEKITEIQTHKQLPQQPKIQPTIQQKQEELKFDIVFKPIPVEKTSNIKKKGKKKPPTNINKNMISSDLLYEEQIPFIQQPLVQVLKIQKSKQEIIENEEALQQQPLPQTQILQKSNIQNQKSKTDQHIDEPSREVENIYYNNQQTNYQQPIEDKKIILQQDQFSQKKEQLKHQTISHKYNDAIDEAMQFQQQIKMVEMKQFSKIPSSNNKKVSKKPKTKAKSKVETNSNNKLQQFLSIQQDVVPDVIQKRQKIQLVQQKIQEKVQQNQLSVQTHTNEPIQVQEKPQNILITSKMVHIPIPIIQQPIHIIQSQSIQHQQQLVQQLRVNEPIQQDLPQPKAQQNQENELAIQIYLNDPKSNKNAQKNKKPSKKLKQKGKTQIKKTFIIEKASIDQDLIAEIESSDHKNAQQVKVQVIIEKPKTTIESQVYSRNPPTIQQKINTDISASTEKKDIPIQDAKILQRASSSGEQKKKQIVSELINLIRFHNDNQIRIMRDRMQMLEEDIYSRKLRSKELPRKQAKKTDYEWILEENIALKNQQRSLNRY